MFKPTTDFKAIPFIAEHAIDLVAKNTMTHAEKTYLLETHIHNLTRENHAVSVVNNGHLLGSGGVYPVWPNLGEAWVIPSNLIHQHKRIFIQIVRKHLEDMTDKFAFTRVQATAKADFPKAQRFLEFLGFEREGLLRKYGVDGSDHILYAKIKE